MHNVLATRINLQRSVFCDIIYFIEKHFCLQSHSELMYALLINMKFKAFITKHLDIYDFKTGQQLHFNMTTQSFQPQRLALDFLKLTFVRVEQKLWV